MGRDREDDGWSGGGIGCDLAIVLTGALFFAAMTTWSLVDWSGFHDYWAGYSGRRASRAWGMRIVSPVLTVVLGLRLRVEAGRYLRHRRSRRRAR
ncbi:MAG TPA: hypothetical protein VF520_04260 [Thermoleophilaceae bacterium]